MQERNVNVLTEKRRASALLIQLQQAKVMNVHFRCSSACTSFKEELHYEILIPFVVQMFDPDVLQRGIVDAEEDLAKYKERATRILQVIHHH